VKTLRFVIAAGLVLGACGDGGAEDVVTGPTPDETSSLGEPEGRAPLPPPDNGPIGGGASSGTGLTVDLDCPPGVAERSEEWYGPVGHDMDGAVREGFADLIVGRLGDPELLRQTEEWATWGLRLPDSALVAALTVVADGTGGWDASHARYCDIRPPEPVPPPLTLYVSNQSFDDPSVDITVTIDGRVVVDEEFDVEGQHNWKTFELDLGPGEHTLRAESSTGAVHEAVFVLPEGEPRWAVLDNWWYPEEGERHFTFSIHDEPVGFA
jgi:hypothetical protein